MRVVFCRRLLAESGESCVARRLLGESCEHVRPGDSRRLLRGSEAPGDSWESPVPGLRGPETPGDSCEHVLPGDSRRLLEESVKSSQSLGAHEMSAGESATVGVHTAGTVWRGIWHGHQTCGAATDAMQRADAREGVSIPSVLSACCTGGGLNLRVHC